MEKFMQEAILDRYNNSEYYKDEDYGCYYEYIIDNINVGDIINSLDMFKECGCDIIRDTNKEEQYYLVYNDVEEIEIELKHIGDNKYEVIYKL